MGILPLKKRVNRDKCSFTTKHRMFGCLGSSLSMRSFAINEPRSPARALYATLLDSAKDNLVTFGNTIWNVQTWFSKAGPDESGDQNLIAGRSCCQYFLEQRPNSSLLYISFRCLCSVWSFWVVVWVQWAWTDVSFRNWYHCITPFGFETEVNLIDHLGTRQA